MSRRDPQASLSESIMALAALPPEQFELAMKTVEAQLARDHELHMQKENNQVLDAANIRAHALFTWGLVAGFTLASGMIIAAVVVGLHDHVWLAASLSGPSVVVLAGLFVLRRLETKQVATMAQSQTRALIETLATPPPA